MLPVTHIINYNHSTNLYEVKEGKKLYSMELKHIQLLKQYLKTHKKGVITDWYNKLADSTKNKIIISEN